MNRRTLITGLAALPVVVPAVASPPVDRAAHCRMFHDVKTLGGRCSNTGNAMQFCDTCGGEWICCDQDRIRTT